MKSFCLAYLHLFFFFYFYKISAHCEHQSINMKIQELLKSGSGKKKHFVQLACVLCLCRLVHRQVDFAFSVRCSKLASLANYGIYFQINFFTQEQANIQTRCGVQQVRNVLFYFFRTEVAGNFQDIKVKLYQINMFWIDTRTMQQI